MELKFNFDIKHPTPNLPYPVLEFIFESLIFDCILFHILDFFFVLIFNSFNCVAECLENLTVHS